MKRKGVAAAVLMNIE